jgi:hypothetical protein
MCGEAHKRLFGQISPGVGLPTPANTESERAGTTFTDQPMKGVRAGKRCSLGACHARIALDAWPHYLHDQLFPCRVVVKPKFPFHSARGGSAF